MKKHDQKIRSSEGKLYLSVILFWLLTIIISPQVTMGENVKKYEDNISITIVPDETVHNSGMADCAEQLTCITACDWNDNLNITLDSRVKSDNLQITVYSMHGQSLIQNIFSLSKGKNYYQVPVQTLNSGVYFVNILIDGIYYKTEKIIIIR